MLSRFACGAASKPARVLIERDVASYRCPLRAIARSMLARALCIVGATLGIMACRSVASSPDAAPVPPASSSPAGSGDLRFVGPVLRIEASTLPRSKLNWVVTMRVDRVLEGRFTGAEFAFRVHSPSRAGLVPGGHYPVHAVAVPGGWLVDEMQWQRPAGGQTEPP